MLCESLNPGRKGAGGGPSPDAVSPPGSDEPEDQGFPDPKLQPHAAADADADAVRRSLKGRLPPRTDILAHNVGKAKKVNFAVNAHRPGLVLAGAGPSWRAGLVLCIPGSLFLAHLANMWLSLLFPRPVHGYFYPPDGGRGGGGGQGLGGRLLRTPASRRGPGPGGVRLCLRPDSGIQLWASSPAFQPLTPPSWPHCPFGTHRNAPQLRHTWLHWGTLASRSGSRGLALGDGSDA